MSWFLSFSSLAEFHNSAGKVDSDDSPEVQEQKFAARAAAEAIIASGCVGRQDVTVSLAGHANPNHQPTAGNGDDLVTISIVQKSQRS